MALALVGDDLYAATGTSGGIYRIQGLGEDEPEVTMIYAREDLRRVWRRHTRWAASR